MEAPFAADPLRDEIVLGIFAAVVFAPVTDLEIFNWFVGPVHEVVRRTAGPETDAHARSKGVLAAIGAQSGMTGKHEDELLLHRMAMEQRRLRAGCKGSEVHAKAGQTKRITQRTLHPSFDLRCERRRVV